MLNSCTDILRNIRIGSVVTYYTSISKHIDETVTGIVTDIYKKPICNRNKYSGLVSCLVCPGTISIDNGEFDCHCWGEDKTDIISIDNDFFKIEDFEI